jgi:mucin-2 (MUC-2) (intestinal mucin-2)
MRNIFYSLLALLALGLGSCQRETGLTNVQTSETTTDHLIIKEVFYAGHAMIRTPSTSYNGGYSPFPGGGGYGDDTDSTAEDSTAEDSTSAATTASTRAATSEKRFYTRVDNDQYITIYNPSKQTLYLDSLAIVTNQIDPRVIFEFAPGDNFVNSYYGVNSIMCFPGKGHDYPVKPGQTIVIANHAIDHAKDYEKYLDDNGENLKEYEGIDQFLDLSKADFEWSPSTDKNNNPNVPDLMPITPGRAMSTIPEAVGLALVRLPWSPATFAQYEKRNPEADKKAKVKNPVHYINVTNTDFADFIAVEIPFNNVIDCMTICPRKRFLMKPSKLDKGFLGVTEENFSSYNNENLLKVMGLSLQRKFDGKGFVDTDNTTTDFEVKPASLSRKAAAPEKPAAKPAQ